MARHIGTDQLERRIVKLCDGKPEIEVFDALLAVLGSLIEQISDDGFRKQLTTCLLLGIVQLPAFQNVPACEHVANLGEIAAIEDVDIRNSRIIAAMRSLGSVFVSVPEYGLLRPDLRILNPRYIADQSVDARVLTTQLAGLFRLAAATLRQVPDKQGRARVMLMSIQAFILWCGFNSDEISKIKRILATVAALPDEEFTNPAIFESIDSVVNGSNL